MILRSAKLEQKTLTRVPHMRKVSFVSHILYDVFSMHVSGLGFYVPFFFKHHPTIEKIVKKINNRYTYIYVYIYIFVDWWCDTNPQELGHDHPNPCVSDFFYVSWNPPFSTGKSSGEARHSRRGRRHVELPPSCSAVRGPRVEDLQPKLPRKQQECM